MADPMGTAVTQQQGRHLLGRAHISLQHKVAVPSTSWLAQVQCYEWAQPLHGGYLQNEGRDSLTMPSRLIFSHPTATKQQTTGLSLHICLKKGLEVEWDLRFLVQKF